ncbi:hypothetical protein [Roseomonas indoligenes]|uniref:Uncharacterized protein n=1 Tax=Roseomonas indoligenes TaxID=2820811 RepID=A0A940MRD9_9PROT|nr:hypothetical protein [Pararoseomonas indoligenes]MBP0492079.1 hypothetical protein [Pararoseomonas indoligenes]
MEGNPAARLDPASVRTLARFFLFLGFAGLWCAVIHLITARPVTPVPMLVTAAGMAAGFAAANRERPGAESLNRWDETVAFIGLAGLANALVRASG